MADAGAGLDAGHFRAFGACFNQSCTTTGDEEVYITYRFHQIFYTLPGGVLHQLYQLRRQTYRYKPLLHGIYDGICREKCILAAAQYAGRTGLYRQGSSVGGYIGTAFINDGNDTHGNTHPVDDDAIGTGYPVSYLTYRVRQVDHLPNSFGHAVDPVSSQCQPVQHGLRKMILGGFHILCIFLQNGFFIGFQGISHGRKRPVFQFGFHGCQCGSGSFCGL